MIGLISKNGLMFIRNWCIGRQRLTKTEDRSMSEVLETQKEEANANFGQIHKRIIMNLG